MAAGDPFTMVPHEVIPLDPEYHNVITESESMKKEYMNIAATPNEDYELVFKALSNGDRETLLAHYEDQSGGYYLFSWQSVPSYVESGSNISGRWIDGSYRAKPAGPLLWDCKVTFRKDI